MANDPPPLWAQNLITQVSQLTQGQLSLQASVAQLQQQGPQPGNPPTYPATVSAEAVETMNGDARVPPGYRPFLPLLQLALPHAIADEDVATTQAAYSALLAVVQGPAALGTAAAQLQPGGTAAGGQGHFIFQDGRQLYVSKKGRYYDTALPPPFPCRYCQCLHWNWIPCPSAGPRSYPSYPGGFNAGPSSALFPGTGVPVAVQSGGYQGFSVPGAAAGGASASRGLQNSFGGVLPPAAASSAFPSAGVTAL